ncbi:glycine cleavage system H protein [Longimycelium tulufanense]|uniref:Glycine cleavage system H protein n=1 Tax=Longimycelium tulufanense TaxID=907463 RepID=A0A8J3CD48_9PSEU|nr:glycine cleavage system H protein [Longimycelium tulufanense]
MVPEELRYTEQHEWVARTGDDTVRVGITDYAQGQLGDVVFVQLPEVGRKVTAGDSLGEVESTKSVSDIYAPLSGEVVAVNEAVVTAPETINEAPYGDGWLVEVRLDDPASVQGLLDAAGYRDKIGEV